MDALDRVGLPTRLSDFLLTFAGRVDDDALIESREFLAVAELGRAVELLLGTLAAGPVPITAAERDELARFVDRLLLDERMLDRLALTERVNPQHRFTSGAAGDPAPEEGVLPALRGVLRVLPDVRGLWSVWRTTPAGSVPGPVPQRVVLIEVGSAGFAPSTAYRSETALRQAGIRAVVEVLRTGGAVPSYHDQALAAARAIPLGNTLPPPGTGQPDPVQPGQSQPGHLQPGQSQPGSQQPQQPSPPQPSPPSPSQPSPPQPSHAQPSPVQQGHAQQAPGRPGEVPSGRAAPGMPQASGAPQAQVPPSVTQAPTPDRQAGVATTFDPVGGYGEMSTVQQPTFSATAQPFTAPQPGRQRATAAQGGAREDGDTGGSATVTELRSAPSVVEAASRSATQPATPAAGFALPAGDEAEPEQAQPEQVQPEQVQPEQVQPEQVQPEQVQPEPAEPAQAQAAPEPGYLPAPFATEPTQRRAAPGAAPSSGGWRVARPGTETPPAGGTDSPTASASTSDSGTYQPTIPDDAGLNQRELGLLRQLHEELSRREQAETTAPGSAEQPADAAPRAAEPSASGGTAWLPAPENRPTFQNVNGSQTRPGSTY